MRKQKQSQGGPSTQTSTRHRGKNQNPKAAQGFLGPKCIPRCGTAGKEAGHLQGGQNRAHNHCIFKYFYFCLQAMVRLLHTDPPSLRTTSAPSRLHFGIAPTPFPTSHPASICVCTGTAGQWLFIRFTVLQCLFFSGNLGNSSPSFLAAVSSLPLRAVLLFSPHVPAPAALMLSGCCSSRLSFHSPKAS